MVPQVGHLKRLEDGIESPGTRIKVVYYELLCMCWDLNLVPLQEINTLDH